MFKRALHGVLALAMTATLGLAALPQEAYADETLPFPPVTSPTTPATEPIIPTPMPSPILPTPSPVLPTPVLPTPVTPPKPAPAPMKPTVYTQPGDHWVNGRFWKTDCEMYSTTVVRCKAQIWATKVVNNNGTYYNHNGWVFNNMTYLPSAESNWSGNRLAFSNEWSATDGRKWRTECNTPQTGQGGCRSYNFVSQIVNEGGKFVRKSGWTFNNIVQFSTASLAAQRTILPASPKLPNMPVEKAFVAPKPKPIVPTSSFRADYRCTTGRVLCISKSQRQMAWMVDGQVLKTFDVRFGSPRTPTRNGAHSVGWKSRDHVSSLYDSAMPFAMFFDGGQAVHYSSDFASRGYSGASKGCVNVRDYAGIKWLYGQIRVRDKVIVYN